MHPSTELLAGASTATLDYMPVAAQPELSISDLLGIIARRKFTILATLVGVTAIAAALCVSAPRLYKASAVVQVQKETADALSLNNIVDGSTASSDAIESNVTLQTEAQVLQSESLALEVIRQLKLEDSPDFRPRFTFKGWVMGLFSKPGEPESRDLALEDAPARRTRAVHAFESALKVKPLSGTRLIQIEYYSRDPKTAAAVVNQLVQNLTNFNFETRHAATQQASAWLAQQLADLRKQSEDLQSRVVALQHGSGMFTLGQADSQGREQVYTPVLDRLQQATAHLTEAQSARIMKGALYQVVKDGDPELISGLAGNTLSGASAGVSGSLTLLQGLRAQEAQVQAQLTELSAKFGPGYPKVGEVQANLASIHKAIADESTRVASRVRNDYAVSQQIENKDRAVFEQEKSRAELLNSKAVEYEIVRQEATQSRTLYENLLGRLKEADLVAGLHSSNITLVDPARSAPRPAKPNTTLYAAGGLLGGLVLGICAALLRESTDSRIQNIAEMEALSSQAPIGFLPLHEEHSLRKRLRGVGHPTIALAPSTPPDIPAVRWRSMVAASASRSPYTEALRALRTSLIECGQGRSTPQVVLVTSSVPGEGKSMLSINLAVVYAQRGRRVLLVDGDLRTPVLHQRLCLPWSHGLGSLLTDRTGEPTPLQPIHIPLEGTPGLDVIPAGETPAYPAELLASDEMAEAIRRWRTQYDHILIDGAPLLPVTDSALLSRQADFTLMVARHNMTDRRSLARSCQILRSQGFARIGVVLNGVKMGGDAHYKYYGYKNAAYEGGQLRA